MVWQAKRLENHNREGESVRRRARQHLGGGARATEAQRGRKREQERARPARAGRRGTVRREPELENHISRQARGRETSTDGAESAMSAERRERARQKARRARTNKERARESCGRAAEAHCGLDHRAARAWAETKVLHPHTDSAKQAARRREARSRTPTKDTTRQHHNARKTREKRRA